MSSTAENIAAALRHYAASAEVPGSLTDTQFIRVAEALVKTVPALADAS